MIFKPKLKALGRRTKSSSYGQNIESMHPPPYPFLTSVLELLSYTLIWRKRFSSPLKYCIIVFTSNFQKTNTKVVFLMAHAWHNKHEQHIVPK